jgi:dTDP-6-deoxy-L-talose 4-dehydrogenase (NAD+)
VINCSRGIPISIIDLVNEYIKKKNSHIKLIRDQYSYPEYEPLAFWGIPTKLTNAGFFENKIQRLNFT